MSLENLQTLSKLSPNLCVFFLSGCTIFFGKEVVHAYFFEFGVSLEIFQTHSFFQKHFFWKMISDKDFFVSLERVWSEFGESLENLQTHSKLTKKSLLDVIFFLKDFLFWRKKMGKKMSLENLQTLSKLKKNMRSQLFFEFFWVVERIFFSKKKLWTHIFFEFGESLERVWRFSKLIFFFFFFQKKLKNDIKQRFLCEFGVSLEILQTLSKLTPNSLQTHMFPFFRCFFSSLLFFLEKRNEFGVSLEIFQTLSKLAPNSYVFIFFVFFFCFTFFWKRGMNLKISPNSLQTHMFSFFLYFFFIFTFFWKRGMSLEWVWRFSKLSPNSYLSIFLNLLFLDKRNEFGVSLEILQTDCKFGPNSYVFMFFLFFSKLSPNSLQTQMISCFIVFSLYCFFIFVWKRQTTLEWVWRFSKLFPNSLQSHMFSGFSVFFCSFLFIIYFTFLGKGEWVWNEFGVSLGILQTHPKLKWFLFFSVCFPIIVILNIFLGREEWVWSKFGGSSNSLQTYSKLTPNSYGFILLFLLYSQLIVFSFFWKRNEFSFSLLDLFKDKGMNLEVPQSLSNLAEGTCSYSAGTWNYILWPLFYWNISNKPCERISPGAAKLVQVISLRPHFRQIVSTGDRWTLRHGEPRSQVPGCCVSEKSTNPGNPHVTFLETRISSRTFPEEKPYRSKGLTFLVFWVIRPQTRSS